MSLFRSLFGRPAPPPAETRQETPAKQEEFEEQSQPQDRRRAERVNAREGTRVLIIDDSPTIVAALKKILVSAGYSTREAFDAETGLEIARSDHPELIFLDIVLPGMNGFAALRMMRRDPQTQHIPIIMISGNEQATEQFYANRIGADDFMKKPFSRAEVFARIAPLLDPNLVPRRKGLSAEDGGHPPTPAAAPAQQPQPGASFAPAVAPVAAPAPAAAPAQFTAPAVAPVSAPVAAAALPSGPSPLEARKELTAMGLQYFDQQQFLAAIQRGDKMAFELFVTGGGIDITAETDGKTPLQVARENGRTQIFALLRSRIAAAGNGG